MEAPVRNHIQPQCPRQRLDFRFCAVVADRTATQWAAELERDGLASVRPFTIAGNIACLELEAVK